MQNYNLKFKNFTFFIVILSFTFLILNLGAAAAAGLVPCGGPGQHDCTICDLFTGVKNIIDFLVEIAWLIGVIILIYAGVMLLTSGESETRREKGKKALWAAVWGLLIVFAAWLIIDTIIKYLISGSFKFPFGPWNAIPSC